MSLYDLLPSFQIASEPSPTEPAKAPTHTSTPSRQLKRLSLAPNLPTSSLSPTFASNTTVDWKQRKPELPTRDRAATSPNRQTQFPGKGVSDDDNSVRASLHEGGVLSSVMEGGYIPKTPDNMKRQRRRPQSIIIGKPTRSLGLDEGRPSDSDITHSLARLQPRPQSLTDGHRRSSGGSEEATPYISPPIAHVLASTPSIQGMAHSQSEAARRISHDRPLTLAEEHGDLLRAIAHREAKVTSARKALDKEEKDLGMLKAKWAAVISRSDQHSTTITRPTANLHIRKPSSVQQAPSNNRPQPANAARLLPSPAHSHSQPYPLTRTGSSTSTNSNLSNHSFAAHSSLQSLQSATHTASTLVNQGLATMGMGDLAQLTSGAASGKVVEGGRRFVGHMWDALQGVAEGVVMTSPGQGVESEYARAEQNRDSKIGIARIPPTTPTGRHSVDDGAQAGTLQNEDVFETVGRMGRTSSVTSHQLFQGPSVSRARSVIELSTPPRSSLPPTGKSRNMRSLSLVSSSTERAMDTALADNLVDLDAGEGLGDKLEGLGFVPLSPRKATPRRGRTGSGPQTDEVGTSPTSPMRTGGDMGSWTARIANAMSSPSSRKRLSGPLIPDA